MMGAGVVVDVYPVTVPMVILLPLMFVIIELVGITVPEEMVIPTAGATVAVEGVTATLVTRLEPLVMLPVNTVGGTMDVMTVPSAIPGPDMSDPATIAFVGVV
jgi:hypothetical protein